MRPRDPQSASAPLLRRFLDLPGEEQRLLLEAWASLLAVTVRLRLAPRRTLARALSVLAVPRRGTGDDSAASLQLQVARAAAHHLWPMTCLPQALALQAMLRRRKIPSLLRIGVRAEPGGAKPIAAHAWVEVGGVALGEPEAIEERFRPLLPVEPAAQARD